MPDTNPAATPSLTKIRAVLAEHGEVAAGTLAERAGLAYPTTTAQLRLLEKDGHAERFRAEDRRTLWRLTDTGRAAASTDQHHDQPDPDSNVAASTPVDRAPQPRGDAPGRQPNGESDTPGADADEPAPAAPRRRRRQAQDVPAAPVDEAPTAGPHADAEAGQGGVRRAHGALRGAVAKILENNADQQYKVGQLCKLLNDAAVDAAMPAASAGAVANALHKLVTAGIAVQTVDRPATFQLATGVHD
jgi:DNA-binding MarR family transcriptional regulator